MDGLSPNQSAVLHWVRHHIEFNGYPPTRAEIARKFHYRSPNAAEDKLRALERKGYLVIRSGIARGLLLTPSAHAAIAADFAAAPLVVIDAAKA